MNVLCYARAILNTRTAHTRPTASSTTVSKCRYGERDGDIYDTKLGFRVFCDLNMDQIQGDARRPPLAARPGAKP